MLDDLFEDILKNAALQTPTKEEAKKEELPKELEKIKCQNCGYIGRTNKKGECPRCFAIGGLKYTPSEQPEEDGNKPIEEKPISYQQDAEHDDKETDPY